MYCEAMYCEAMYCEAMYCEADDTSAGGFLTDLYDWFTLLCPRGPAFGYTPQPSKCFVVVAAPFQHQTEDIFGKLGVKTLIFGWIYWRPSYER